MSKRRRVLDDEKAVLQGYDEWENVGVTIRQGFLQLKDYVRRLERREAEPAPREPVDRDAAAKLRKEILEEVTELLGLKTSSVAQQAQQTLPPAPVVDPEMAQKLQSLEREVGELRRLVARAPDARDVDRALVNKVDNSSMIQALENLVEVSQLSRVELAMEKHVEATSQAFRALEEDLDAHRSALEAGLEKLEHEMRDSAQSLSELQAAVKLEQEQPRAHSPPPPPPPVMGLQDPDAAEERLSRLERELQQQQEGGRWIWRGGRDLVDDSLIPWHIERASSSKSSSGSRNPNFLWDAQRDPSTIVAVHQGLYALSLGFFADEDPKRVEVLVNDEIALLYARPPRRSSSAASHSLAYADPSMGLMRSPHHESGNVTGWTLSNHLALPPNARLRLRVESDANPEETQAFLALKKF